MGYESGSHLEEEALTARRLGSCASTVLGSLLRCCTPGNLRVVRCGGPVAASGVRYETAAGVGSGGGTGRNPEEAVEGGEELSEIEAGTEANELGKQC
jgi:hypothetical protein